MISSAMDVTSFLTSNDISARSQSSRSLMNAISNWYDLLDDTTK